MDIDLEHPPSHPSFINENADYIFWTSKFKHQNTPPKETIQKNKKFQILKHLIWLLSTFVKKKKKGMGPKQHQNQFWR